MKGHTEKRFCILHPCPFCGGDAREPYRDDEYTVTIECMTCGGMYVGSTLQRAVTGWNNRSRRDEQ